MTEAAPKPKGGRFCRLPTRAMREKLKPTQFRILAAICLHVNNRGRGWQAWPSNELLAEQTGLHKRHVWQAVKELVALNYISREIIAKPSGGTFTLYTVHGLDGTSPDDATLATDEMAGDGTDLSAVLNAAAAAPEKPRHGFPDNHGTDLGMTQHGFGDAAALKPVPEHPNESPIEKPLNSVPPSAAKNDASHLKTKTKEKTPEAFEGKSPEHRSYLGSGSEAERAERERRDRRDEATARLTMDLGSHGLWDAIISVDSRTALELEGKAIAAEMESVGAGVTVWRDYFASVREVPPQDDARPRWHKPVILDVTGTIAEAA